MVSKNDKQKRTQERRKAAAKESTSIRLSQNEREIIQEKADAKGMKCAEYIRDCALHGGNSISPHAKMLLQDFVNITYNECMKYNPEKAEFLMREVKKAWNL